MNNYTHYVFPPQKKLFSQKTEVWQKQCVDAIQSMSSYTVYNGRTSKYRKQVNYDLYNSKFDEADFEYILNPYGVKEQFGSSPARMQDYNVIRSKIELLKGEEIKRPFNFKAAAVNGEAVTLRQEEMKKRLHQSFMSSLGLEMGVNGEQPEDPLYIQKYFKTEYSSPQEIVANQMLHYLIPKEKLRMKFMQGWEHSLIAAEEIYYIGIVDGEPIVRVVNPLNFDYDKDPELKFIEDSQWCKEERYLPVGAVIDEYGEFLSDIEIDKLDSGEIGGQMNNRGMQHSFAYTPEQMYGHSQSTPNGHIYVVNVCWKSMRKIGFLSFTDEKGIPQETIVDDDFTLTREMKSLGYSVEWQWKSEIWEGTKIGGDIYVNVRPRPNQLEKMPYVGYIYNNTNSQATSIVDLIKPHQYTYIIVWYRLELELAKSKGKKFVMDIAQVPKSKGWTLDQWMYYFDNLGVAWINSAEEGREGDPNSISKFNQFASIDMSLSNIVGQYMMILQKLEEQIADICGVSKQREGQISEQETATNAGRNIQASQAITEPLFYYHNLVKQNVLTTLLETAKIAYIDGKKIQYIVDDIYTHLLQIDGGLLNDSDYGVFVSDSAKDQQIKEKLEVLGQAALQNDKARLSDIIRILESDSISEIKSTIISGEREKESRDQQQSQIQQKQMELQDRQLKEANQMKLEEAEKDRQLQRDIKQMDIDKDLFATDSNSNGIPDAVDIAKLQLERERLVVQTDQENKRMFQEQLQHKQESILKNKELDLKDRDSARKVQIAKSKPKTYKKK